MEVSTPSHPRYGQHLKREELKSLIKPRAESTRVVLNWLEQSGIQVRDIQNDGEWINFYAPVKHAEELMNTTFKTYQSEHRPNIRKIRSLHYSVPKEIRRHIDMIQPTTRFGQIQPERSQVLYKEAAPFSMAAVNTSCNIATTPNCLAGLYNFADYKIAPEVNVTIGVSGFLEQYARYADFRQFATSYSPKTVGSTFSFTSINGKSGLVSIPDFTSTDPIQVDFSIKMPQPAALRPIWTSNTRLAWWPPILRRHSTAPPDVASLFRISTNRAPTIIKMSRISTFSHT